MSSFFRHAAWSALALFMTVGVALAQKYNQTNLVANTSGVALVTDPALVNPWGLSRSSGSPWWISDNATGVATLYNGSKTDFLLAAATPAVFLFSTLDGTVVGWNPGVGTITVVKTTDGSSYTGLTAATVGGQRRLYAANFTKGRIDVYDNRFHRIDQDGEHFDNDRLPRGYVPFNVQAIGNDIVVTYALHEDGNLHETDGPGLGRVVIYSAEGQMLQRLEHGDWLNAPWGVALAPLDFGMFSHDLLVAQFAGGGTTQSSGYIAAYDLATGRFDGLLEDATGEPLAINGIWAISPGNNSPNNFDSAGAGAPSAELYFTAGPDHGSGGLFGYLTAVSTELIEGNSQ